MITPTIAPPRPLERSPAFQAPPGAWDCHCHVFGPNDEFPYAEERSYTPHDVSAERLLQLHDALGFERAVLVQPAAHGTDHRAMLDALDRSGGLYRGVMLVDNDGQDLDVATLHTRGIRAVRYNFLPHLGAPPDMGVVKALVERITSQGWHLCLHTQPRQFGMLTQWLDLGVPVVLDHIGRPQLHDPETPAALDMLRRLLDHPALFLKLSGIDRMMEGGGTLAEALSTVRNLFETAPHKCLWGTDFPHPNHTHIPDDADLVDLIPRMVPESLSQNMLLVENPNRLYC